MLLAPFTGRSVPSRRGTATPQIVASISAALGSELASLRCTKSSSPPSTPQLAALQLKTPAEVHCAGRPFVVMERAADAGLLVLAHRRDTVVREHGGHLPAGAFLECF